MKDLEFHRLAARLRERPGRNSLIAIMALTAIALATPFALSFWGIPSRVKVMPQKVAVEARASVAAAPPADEVPHKALLDTFATQRLLETDFPDGAARVARQTVPVIYTSGRGWFASGVVVQNDVVVTAGHLYMTGMSGGLMYADCGSGLTQGRALFVDPVRDLMIIYVPGCRGDKLRIEPRPPADEPLYANGFSFGPGIGKLATQFARKSRRTPANDRPPEECDACGVPRLAGLPKLDVPDLLAIEGFSVHGNSGSPVTLADGTLVGLLMELDVEERPISYMIPATTILKGLRYVRLRP